MRRLRRLIRPPATRRGAVALVAGVLALATGAGLLVAAVDREPPEPVGRYGLPLDRDPDSPSLVATRGLPEAQRRSLTRITSRPQAVWLTETADVEDQVRRRVEGAASRGAVAVLVLYRIPGRDCGSYSAPQDDLRPAAYRAWVRSVAAGLGERRAVVLVEPDALPQLDCLRGAARAARVALLRDAVDVLADQGSWVYVDAGHSGWRSAAVMARRLRSVDVRRATGFSLNVSAYGSTAREVAYGRTIVEALGRPARFVVDTGRNGATVKRGRWCNAPAARLGAAPTSDPRLAGVDALLWVKTPGVSDGTCRGGPRAGEFWAAGARRLLGRD